MLKFFRKIRKNLINQNRFSKYLIYAIGEIILVVIGILIALSINNWNEGRKSRVVELKVLKQIEADLKKTLPQLDGAVNAMQEIYESCEIIINVWENKSTYSDTLSWHFFKSSWTGIGYMTGISTSGYDNLQNLGFDLIQNDSIRERIIHVYGKRIPQLLNQFNTPNENAINKEHYLKTFLISYDNNWVPFDYDKLLNDQFYYSIVNNNQTSMRARIERLSSGKVGLEKHLKSIRQEINRLEDL